MLTIRLALRAACGAALLAAALVSPAAAAPYAFTNIIDSMMDPDLSFNLFLAIDGPTMAIDAGDEIFTLKDGLRTDIVKVGDSTSAGTIQRLGSWGLSGGNVAFGATTSTLVPIVLRGSGGPLTLIVKDGDPTPDGPILSLSTENSVSISGDNVAFHALTSPGSGGSSGVYVGSGSGLTSVVSSGDPAPSETFTTFSFYPGASSISGDRVAFLGTWGAGGGISGALISQGGALTTIAQSGDVTAAGTLGSAMSGPLLSGDAVALSVNLREGGRAIFTGNGGALTTIVKVGDQAPSGTFTSLTLRGFANNGQDVLFDGTWSGGRGVFISSGGVYSPVIKRGDMLFGQQLTVVEGAVIDSSGSDRVAFSYRLADGTRGVALATPVPEPGTGVMLACIGALLSAKRGRRRRP
jgi:hypothetical protein